MTNWQTSWLSGGISSLTPQTAMSQVIQRLTTSNQDVGTNGPIQRWKIRSWTSVARGRSKVAEQLLLCNEAAQVPRTTPTEKGDATKALSGNHWHGFQRWILENSSMDQWKHVKGVENTADIWTRGMSFQGLWESVWLNGPAWLKNYEDDWQKPWCQENEVEAEQAIRTLATVTQVEQTFDWNRYSSFKKIRNFIAFCMRFKTKEKGPSKQTRSIKQNKNCFNLFAPKFSRMFQSR